MKIMALAIGVAGVLLGAGLLMAILPSPSSDPAEKESSITLPGTQTVQMGENKVIDGQLKDQDGNALGGEVVSIDATLPNGDTGSRSTVITDDSGKFAFAVAPTMSGQYRVTVSFDGNEECKPSSYVVIIVVVLDPDPTPVATQLEMRSPGPVSVGGSAYINGTLKTVGGEAISWTSVVVKVTDPGGVMKGYALTTGSDGKFSMTIDAKAEGDYIVAASYTGNEIYGSSSSTLSFTASEGTVAPPQNDESEPRLNIAYLSGTWGNTVRYGMPSARSGPYPGWEQQYPADNEFRIETNGYGPDQPDGPTNIALFIQIDGIGSRWVGSTEIPEGTVEVRTFPENAYTPRLVNLFDDGQGNCKGILVKDWSVFDHTFVYEQGVTDRDLLTFSLDITKLGSYKVSVWAVHDHGDGDAVQVSNMISWTVQVDGSNICSSSFDPSWTTYENNTAYTVTATVARNTEPDDDNSNVRNTIAYTGTVRNYLLVDGLSGYTLRINGVVQTGTVVDGKLRFDLGSFDFSDMASKSYTFTITGTDGRNHDMWLQSVDAGNGQQVGSGYGYFYHPWW